MKHLLLLSLVTLLGLNSVQTFSSPGEMSDTVFCQLEEHNVFGLDIEDENDESTLFHQLSTEFPQYIVALTYPVAYQLPLRYFSFHSRAPPTFLN